LRTGRSLTLIVPLFLCPAVAFAQDQPRAHGDGFFLRLAPGLGYAASEVDDGSLSLKFSGFSGSFDVAGGYFVSENLALHVSSGYWKLVDPKVELDGSEIGMQDLSFHLLKYGLGLTYYVGRSNVYLTGSVGLAKLEAELEGETYGTDTGFSAEVGVGKEWWLGSRLGIGVAALVNYHSVPSDLTEPFRGTSFAVQLSATLD
jgi:hypothetical protein